MDNILEARQHNHRLRSKQYYEKNKDKVLTRQKAYRKQETAQKPWIYMFNNARAKAKMKGYLGEVDVPLCRSLFQRAWETGQRIALDTPPEQGGLFTYGNLKMVPKEIVGGVE